MAIKELFYDQRPVALLNPRASQRIDPRFKFTRASTGTYVDSSGIIRVAGSNEPRISANPYVASQSGLIIEPERTNYIHFSEDLTDAGWTKSNLTVSKETIAGPGGYIPYDKITLGTFGPPANNTDYTSTASIRRGTAASLTSGTKFAISIYLKAGTCRYVEFIKQGLNSAGYSLYFDLETGTQYSGGSPGNGISGYKIDPAGNGWYRIIMYGTEIGPGGSDGLIIVPMTESNPLVALNGFRLFTGNGEYIYAWGGQYEEGTVETSYIPTFSAADVTRNADLLSINSVAIPSAGSIYVDAQAASAAETDTLISLKNASNEKINLSYESNAATYNSLALIASYKGTSKSSLPLPVPTTARERNIITWGANNYQYTTDSSRYATSLSSSVPADLTQLSIGHDAVDPTKAFNGYINAVYLYNGEITPAVAEALVRGELDPINADTYSPVGPTGSLALVINTQGATASGDKTFTLPAESASNDNDIVITWGDGTESGLDGASAELGAPGLTHTYPAAGIYPVWVEGQLENLQFNNIANAPDLLQIAAWGTSADGNDVFRSPSTMNSAFYGCSQMNFSTSARTTNLPDTSAVTDWVRAFSGCSSLTGIFPSFNFSAAVNFTEAWQNCSSMTAFASAGNQTQNVTTVIRAWQNCTSLTAFPLINTSSVTRFDYAFQGCSSLASIELLNTGSGTNFQYMFDGCSSLTSVPEFNLSSATTLTYMFNGCSSLTTLPAFNTASATNMSGFMRTSGMSGTAPFFNTGSAVNLSEFLRATSITSSPTYDTSLATDMGGFYDSCSQLTAIPPLVTSANLNFYRFAVNCSSLTTIATLNYGAATNMARAFSSCAITSFPTASFPNVVGLAGATGGAAEAGFNSTWNGCASLATFPANAFDSTQATNFGVAFTGCALTAQSIENILVSINTANTSNGNLGIGGGTNAAKTTWSTAANNAYDALILRGWTITYNA